MIVAILVGVTAGLGAVCRYVVDQTVERQHGAVLPLGTFTVNVSGSFLLGLVTGLALHHGLSDTATVTLSAGFCGGYTTWSTFAHESLVLAEDGGLVACAANVFGSLAVGLAAAAAGLGLALL
jgi:CrcB protein